MKKQLTFLALLFVLGFAFGENTKYLDGNGTVSTLYVNSIEGLKVRDVPSLSGKRVAGLVNALSVKVVSVGNETEIDGIKDNWVKILVPCYLWKSTEPEYGWVFGGYLSRERVKYDFDSPVDIANFLCSKMWKSDGGSFFKWYRHDGTYISGKLEAGGGYSGKFTVVSKDTIRISASFFDEDGKAETEVWETKLRIMDEDRIQLGDTVYVSYINVMDWGSFDNFKDFVYGNYGGKSVYDLFAEGYSIGEKERLEYVDTLIKYGVDPSGSEYSERYNAYWSKIK